MTSKPLLDGSLGTISSVHHLSPFSAVVPSQQQLELVDAQQEFDSQQGHRQNSGLASGQQQSSPAYSGPSLVGDGVVALSSSTGVHIAIIRPWGDLIQVSVGGH